MQKICDGLNAAFDNSIVYYDSTPTTLHANTKHTIVKKTGIGYITVKNNKVVPNMEAIATIK